MQFFSVCCNHNNIQVQHPYILCIASIDHFDLVLLAINDLDEGCQTGRGLRWHGIVVIIYSDTYKRQVSQPLAKGVNF